MLVLVLVIAGPIATVNGFAPGYKMDTFFTDSAQRLRAYLACVPLQAHIQVTRYEPAVMPPDWVLRVPVAGPMVLKMITDGEAQYWIDGTPTRFRKGTVLCACKGSSVVARGDGCASHSQLLILYKLVESATRQTVPFPATPLWFAFETTRYQHLMRLFDELLVYTTADAPDNHRGIQSSIMHQLLTCILDDFFAAHDKSSDKRIEKVQLYLKKNPTSRIGVDELAYMAGLSRKYFTRLFQAHTGCSPKEYQVRLRCNYAKYLLEETAMSIKEIAANLGYADQHAFSKQFKKVTGVPPNAWAPKKVVGRGRVRKEE